MIQPIAPPSPPLPPPIEEVTPEAIDQLKTRCAKANLEISESQAAVGQETAFWLRMRCGRDTRSVYVPRRSLTKLLSVDFESYFFLSGFEAICSYAHSTIEASIRPIDFPIHSYVRVPPEQALRLPRYG